MGLDIGAVTLEEIAVAILAEAIQVKRKPEDEARKVSQSDIDMEVIHDLAEPEEKICGSEKGGYYHSEHERLHTEKGWSQDDRLRDQADPGNHWRAAQRRTSCSMPGK